MLSATVQFHGCSGSLKVACKMTGIHILLDINSFFHPFQGDMYLLHVVVSYFDKLELRTPEVAGGVCNSACYNLSIFCGLHNIFHCPFCPFLQTFSFFNVNMLRDFFFKFSFRHPSIQLNLK